MIAARLLVLALLGLLGCTDAVLYGDRALRAPDRVTLTGNLCTDDPAERGFPVRVLFLVDTSIGDGDYISLRGDSLERVVRSYGGGQTSFSVIRYAGSLKGTPCGLRNLNPDGYTRNLEDAIAGVRCSDAIANPGRDLLAALSLARSIVTGDVLATPRGPRARTKYVVVLLANGGPTVSLPALWCSSRGGLSDPGECRAAYDENFCADMQPRPADCERAQYVSIVRELGRFVEENGAQEFFFHTVYQRDPDAVPAGPDESTALELFAELALAGRGSVQRFDGAATCTVSQGDGAGCLYAGIDLESTQAVFIRKQFIVSNRSALATPRGLLVDSDQDGLSDEEERALGTSPLLADTDGDTLSDRLEHLLRSVGLDPLRNDQEDPAGQWPVECPLPGSGRPGAFPPEQDSDGDRLTDCEELLLRSERTLVDSDADGIADPLEFRYGTNLLQDDALADPDADGFANLDELTVHLDPLGRDRNTDDAYQYEIRREQKKEVFSFSQPITLTGITVRSGSPASHEGRATLYYEPPPDPNAPIGPGNPARLSWRDPEDVTPAGADPGRGPSVALVASGEVVLHAAGSSAGDPARELSVVVEVVTEMLPREVLREDVRVRRGERTCFDYTIRNVKLVPTLALAEGLEAGINYVDLFFAQVPENNPMSPGVFRVATIPVAYPRDPLRRSTPREIEVAADEFLLYGE